MVVSVAGTPIQSDLIGFGKRLRQSRERLELSGAQLAARLGLKRSAVPHYETGRTFPSVAVLKKLTQILGVSVDWLLFDEFEGSNEIQDRELAAYFAKADRLSHRDRSLMKDFIDSLLAREKLEELERKRGKPKKAA